MVLGVSADSAQSHRKFKQKYGLPYKLLVDDEHRLSEALGVWKKKSFMGKQYMGIERTTVILDRNGRIARIFPKVQIDGHVEEVEKAVRALP